MNFSFIGENINLFLEWVLVTVYYTCFANFEKLRLFSPTDWRLTGYLGSCSSQLPHFFVMYRIFNNIYYYFFYKNNQNRYLILAFVACLDSVLNMSSLLLTQVSIPERVSAEEFIEWMIAEPQTIVWLPTLHRLAVSETGTVWLILSTVKAPVVSGHCGEAVATGACCTCWNGLQSFSVDF